MLKHLTFIAALAAAPAFADCTTAEADMKAMFANPDSFKKLMGISLDEAISNPELRFNLAVSKYAGLAMRAQTDALSDNNAADLIALDGILTCWEGDAAADRLDSFNANFPAEKRAELMQMAKGDQ